jgi:hypothetical protein
MSKTKVHDFPNGGIIGAAIVEFLESKGGSATTGDIQQGVAKKLGIPESVLAERSAFGMGTQKESRWGLRLRQVRHDLFKKGMLAPSTERGVWSLPPK